MKRTYKIIIKYFAVSILFSIPLLSFLPGPGKKGAPGQVAQPVSLPAANKPTPLPTPAPDFSKKMPSQIPAQSQESSIHPIWYATNAGQKLDRAAMINKFRTICNQLGATENTKIPAKSNDICRVATYNVHFWISPYDSWNKARNDNDFNRIIEVIKKSAPDILILEEVGGAEHDFRTSFDQFCQQAGYNYVVYGSTSAQGVDAPGHLYNCIASKYPFVGQPIKKQYSTNPDPSVAGQNPEQRCFVGVVVQLPNNKTMSVYGTHLEVRPITIKDPAGGGKSLTPENVRKAQLEELVKYISENDKNQNVIIGGDFNGFRRQDLTAYKIGNRTLWDILEQDWPNILKVMDRPANLEAYLDQKPPYFALEYLAQKGYRDSFELSGFRPPQFTTWTGTRIDFLFLNSTWNLPLKGGYVFYNWASDHIPVIVDIAVR
jgi:endonuclease/exonuclease/phosphatase family metal-dependent hydrolase